MSTLNLILTEAGIARFTAAQLGDPIDLTVAAIGLTAQDFYAAPTLTALPGEHRRVTAVSGAVVGDNTAHIVMLDADPVSYTVRGFGLFLADGTLLAAYGQPTPIVEKSVATNLHLPLDLAFPTSAIDRLTFGSTDFLNPPATSERKGVVELATLAEAQAGDAQRVTTGAIVKAMLAAAIQGVTGSVADFIASVSQALDGLAARTAYGAGLVKGGGRNDTNRTFTVDAANGAAVRVGTALDLAVTPAALKDAGVIYVVRSNLAAQGGYREWSDGFIEQWGYIDGAITGEPSIPIAFPIAFKAECFGVSGTVRNTTASNSGSHLVQEVSVSLEGAVVFLQSDNTNTQDAAGGFRWRAEGR